jgi:DNA-binding MarR family transcriptional regulator
VSRTVSSGVPGAFLPVGTAILTLGRAHRALAGELMGEVGLRPEQGEMMMFLWAHGPVRQTVLSERFGKDSALMTRMISRLESAGFVHRKKDPDDGRATLIEPTRAGNALREKVESSWSRLEEITLAGMDTAEREVALAVLTRLGENILILPAVGKAPENLPG